jgi:hypothetical protein
MTSESNIIQGPGSTAPDGMLPEEQMRAANAKSVRDWVDIYLEVIVRVMEQSKASNMETKGVVWERFTGETRPRLRRIAHEFDSRGLVLSDELDISGVTPHPISGKPLWEDATHPWVVFHWEDRQVAFYGAEAPSALHFILWWQQHGLPLRRPRAPKSRIINPGEAEHSAYFDAKRRAQERGEEP